MIHCKDRIKQFGEYFFKPLCKMLFLLCPIFIKKPHFHIMFLM